MTPTNTEALAARLESGWCPIESPADMEQAAAALRRLSAMCAEWEARALTWLTSPEAAQRLAGYRELGRKCAELEAERDALRADAERYRWLREGDNDEEVLRFHDWATEVCVDPPPMYLPRLERLDKLIDAAMKGAKA